MWEDLVPPPNAYVVRAVPPYRHVRQPDDVFPRTLRGLVEALAEAVARSYNAPQEVSVREPGAAERVIRRFEDGREVPMELPLVPRCPGLRAKRCRLIRTRLTAWIRHRCA